MKTLGEGGEGWEEEERGGGGGGGMEGQGMGGEGHHGYHHISLHPGPPHLAPVPYLSAHPRRQLLPQTHFHPAYLRSIT